MRFFLDQNVPASVRAMLQEEGQDCWTASQAGLANEGQDDNLTVFLQLLHREHVTIEVREESVLSKSRSD